MLLLVSQVVLRHPLVIDCAVVGVSDKLKGQMPLGLVVTRGEVRHDECEFVDFCSGSSNVGE